jgi:site-specific recombinase XerD
LLTTGLRKAEICDLKVEDLKTYRNQPIIDVIGKGKKFRRIPLHTDTLFAIKDYHKVANNGADPTHSLFKTLGKHGPYDKGPLTPKSVDCLIKSVVKKALIQKRVHPHVMRHTFATTLLDKGNDLRTVQSLMGHSHIRTTERYLHSTDDRKVEAIISLQFGN